MDTHLTETRFTLTADETATFIGNLAVAMSKAGDGPVTLVVHTREAGYATLAARGKLASHLGVEAKVIYQKVIDPETYTTMILHQKVVDPETYATMILHTEPEV